MLSTKTIRSIELGVIFCVTFFFLGTANAQILDLVAVNKKFRKQPLYILQWHSVLTDPELDLQDLQKTEISKLYSQLRGEKRRKGTVFADLPAMRRRNVEKEYEEELHELSIEYTRKLAEILTPEQDARLLQLCLWNMIGGNYVLMFQETSVQKLLHLRDVAIEDIEKRLKEFSSNNKELLKERTGQHLEEVMSLFNDEQLERIEEASKGDELTLNIKDFVSIEFGKGFYGSFEMQEILRLHPAMNELKKRVFEFHNQIAKAEATEKYEELETLKRECRTFMKDTFSTTLRTEVGEEWYSRMRWKYLKRITATYVLASGPPTEELIYELELSEAQMQRFENVHSSFKERLAEECEAINERQFEDVFALMNDEEAELFLSLFGERPDFDLRVWAIVSGGY
jgi:hypothetical protein